MLAILPLILSIAPEIARWIGGAQAGSITASVAAAVKSVTGTDDPQAAAAAIAADPAKAADLRVQLAKIAADAETAQRQADLDTLKAQLAADAAQRQTELDAFKTSVADTASARDATLGLAKIGNPIAYGAPILSAIIVLAFGVMLVLVLTLGVKQGSEPIANVLLGTLAAMATQVANYWLGSSSGSSHKDALLNNAQNQLAQSVPASLMKQQSISLTQQSPPPQGFSADDLNAMSLAQLRAAKG